MEIQEKLETEGTYSRSNGRDITHYMSTLETHVATARATGRASRGAARAARRAAAAARRARAWATGASGAA